MTVRTRFAPSPTGYLHIGGVRTALFNWLLVQRHGGQFILRIDDTDQARHVEEAVEKILTGFRWLGMDFQEGPTVGGPYGPYFQSQRRTQHIEAIEALIQAGLAYPCRATTEELDTLRRAATAAKRPFVYRGPDRQMPPDECLALFREQKTAIRFKVPEGRTTTLQDHVRGEVVWQTDLLGDFTIARAGGDPLYNLASTADDITMRITHIIRAEEHLSNTHPQILIIEGLGASRPEFAHIPFVAEPGSKKKLSKRSPPPGVMVALEEYERAGYLPEALINALARLGWSLDDKSEIMPIQTIIDHFSLDRITSAPAGLDPDKIFWMQDHYMRALDPEERIHRMIPFLEQEGLVTSPVPEETMAMLRAIDTACGDRLKLLADIVRYSRFFLVEEIDYEDKSRKALTKEGVESALVLLKDKLAELEAFDLESTEVAVKEVAQASGQGGKFNHAVRAAVTGQSVGPGLFDCLVILGRDRVLARIDRTLERLRAGAFGGAA